VPERVLVGNGRGVKHPEPLRTLRPQQRPLHKPDRKRRPPANTTASPPDAASRGRRPTMRRTERRSTRVAPPARGTYPRTICRRLPLPTAQNRPRPTHRPSAPALRRSRCSPPRSSAWKHL
jgi:hypothetical protein